MITLTAKHQNTLDSQYQNTCMHPECDGHIVLAVPGKTPGNRQHLDPSFRRIPAEKQANSECNAKLGCALKCFSISAYDAYDDRT